jgi:hypothetical protein
MTNHTNRWKVTTIALGLIASAAVITTVVTGCNTMEAPQLLRLYGSGSSR